MPIDVWFVMLPGVLSLDMTGPAETFVLAGDAFRLHYIGPQPEVPTSIGLTMSGIQPLPERLPEGSLLVLPGVSDSRCQFSTPQAQQKQPESAHIPYTNKPVTAGQPETYVDTVGQCPFYEMAGEKGCTPPPDIECNADWTVCTKKGE